MIHRGIATFTLDTGKCPRWLFNRMVNLGQKMIWVIVKEYGPQEFIKRISDPVWFQCLGTVLAFDWNASGLTTILTAALKEAIKKDEKELGIFICGGKGRTSLKTPEEIKNWGNILCLPERKVKTLIYNSRMTAKVDSSLVQDGFELYHHSFFFSRDGSWAVVQQGMNTINQTARRYHWYSEKITDLICEPHSGIISQIKTPTVNLTAQESEKNRNISTELVQRSYTGLIKDIKILRRYSSKMSSMVKISTNEGEVTLLNLKNREFSVHPVLQEDFSRSRYLERILSKVCEVKPENYEKLLSLEGVGPKTIRALSLVAEVIYGAKPSYEDPARYSFAHGGKDATPYPIERRTYDTSIAFFSRVIQKMKIPFSEKQSLLKRFQ